jgi:Tol biopolymer transport system component
LEYPDGMNVLYNFRTGQQVTLPPEMADFSFTSSGNEIVAAWLGNHPDDNWIVVANDDGSGLGLVEPLGDQLHNTQIGFSPDGQVAALYRKSVDLQRQEVYPIGLHGENLRSFIVQGSGFTSSWSPEGNSLLYSIHSEATDYLPNLWVTNGQTSNLGDIKVSLNLATWPEKCNFAGENSLYCAVPQGLPRGAGLYPELANDYTDNFYRIDLDTGVKTLIASPVGEVGGYTAYDLFVSADGSILYFTDYHTGGLQSIRLE